MRACFRSIAAASTISTSMARGCQGTSASPHAVPSCPESGGTLSRRVAIRGNRPRMEDLLHWLHKQPLILSFLLVVSAFIVPTLLGTHLFQPYFAKSIRNDRQAN